MNNHNRYDYHGRCGHNDCSYDRSGVGAYLSAGETLLLLCLSGLGEGQAESENHKC